jgi:hypothetical protein
MPFSPRLFLIAAVSFASASSARAQAPSDPAGHWRGTIQAPGMDVSFEVDFAPNSSGEF